MSPLQTTTEPPRAAPLALWWEIEALLRQIHALFGGPDDIAFQHTLTGKAHKLLSSWIRGAEAMARMLLLIEAAALGGPARSNRPARKRRSLRKKRVIEHFPEAPQHWRVCFRLFSSPASRSLRERVCSGGIALRSLGGSPADGREGGSARHPLSHLASRADSSPVKNGGANRSAWPLAERAEALIRVFNNPLPYARRLARRLYAKPGLARALLTQPHTHHVVLIDEIVDALAAAAEAAGALIHRQAFQNSS